MALYLVQHGKSQPKEADPEQGLSAEGVAETERIAQMLRAEAIRVSGVLHSGKARARRTAEILAAALPLPDGCKEAQGLNPLDDVLSWSSLSSDADLMLVGHLPFMERLAALLVAGSQDKPVVKFQNSGIVCLDREPASVQWVIRWAVMPRLGV
jgi:phosphohistidine phosphatase